MKKIINFLKNPFVNVVLILSLSIGALYFTMRGDWQSVISAVFAVNPIYYLLFAFWVLTHQYTMGIILTLIIRSIKPNYKYHQGFVNAISTSFFNGVSPGATGGQFSLLYINTKQGISGSESSSILWFDFMTYQGSLSITVFLLLVFGKDYFWDHHSNLLPFILAGFVVSIGIFVGLWALVRFKWVYNFISKLIFTVGVKLRIIKNPENAIANLDRQIEIFETETVKFKNSKKLGAIVLTLNIIRNLMHFTFPFIVIYTVVPGATFKMLLPSMTLMACIDLIDVFFIVPGAAGLTEGLFALLFGGLFESMGLDTMLVSSVLLIWRFFSYYFIMIVGALTFTGFKIFHIKRST